MSESGVFHGQTAWFSESVRECLKDLWVDNGGHVCDFGSAMFVFSEDAEETDTKSLFTSERYLCDCLAIFHACYVEKAVKAGSMKDVCVGDYFLPPYDIYQKIKKDNPSFRYAWESWSEQHGGKATARTAQQDRLCHSVNKRAVAGHSRQIVTASDSPQHKQKTLPEPRCSKTPSTAVTSAAAVAKASDSRVREERRNGSCLHQSPSDSFQDRSSSRRSKTAAKIARTDVDSPDRLPSSWAHYNPGYVNLEELPAADPKEVRIFIPGVDGAVVYPVDMGVNSNVH